MSETHPDGKDVIEKNKANCRVWLLNEPKNHPTEAYNWLLCMTTFPNIFCSQQITPILAREVIWPTPSCMSGGQLGMSLAKIRHKPLKTA